MPYDSPKYNLLDKWREDPVYRGSEGNSVGAEADSSFPGPSSKKKIAECAKTDRSEREQSYKGALIFSLFEPGAGTSAAGE